MTKHANDISRTCNLAQQPIIVTHFKFQTFICNDPFMFYTFFRSALRKVCVANRNIARGRNGGWNPFVKRLSQARLDGMAHTGSLDIGILLCTHSMSMKRRFPKIISTYLLLHFYQQFLLLVHQLLLLVLQQILLMQQCQQLVLKIIKKVPSYL